MRKPSDPNQNLVKIGQAAKTLNVSIDTLRRWEKAGKISTIRTPGGTRFYSSEHLSQISQIGPLPPHTLTISQAAQKVGVSVKTLRRWDQSGKLPAQRLESGQRIYRADSIEEITDHKPLLEEEITHTNPEWLIKTAAALTILTIFTTAVITTGYLKAPQQTKNFLAVSSTSEESKPTSEVIVSTDKGQVLGIVSDAKGLLQQAASVVLSPFDTLSKRLISSVSPQKAQQLGFTTTENQLKQLTQKNDNLAKDLGKMTDKFSSINNQLTQFDDNLNNLPTGINLVPNSSFEANDNGLPNRYIYVGKSSAANTFLTQEIARSGLNSLKFVGGTAGLGILNTDTVSGPARPYHLSFYLKSYQTGPFNLDISFWDTDKKVRTQTVSKKITASDLTDSSSGWQLLQFNLKSPGPSQGKNWFPVIEIINLTKGVVYLDDVAVKEIAFSGYAQVRPTGAISTLGDGAVYISAGGEIYPYNSKFGSLGVDGKRFQSVYLTNASIDKDGVLNVSGTATFNSTLNVSGNSTLSGDLALNGGNLTTTATTATLFNATATTLSLGGAATTALNLGNGNTAYTAINLGSGTGGNTINIAGTGATGADTINIGSGGTGADTITIGNNASSTSLALTSGTGSQTFTSSATTGTAFSFVANSLTTGNAITVSSTGTTTGEILDLTGTWAATDGSTNEAIDLNITHTPTTSADNFRAIDLDTSDGTALGNTVYNFDGTLTLTGNAAKTGYGIYQTVTTSSTTADTFYAVDLATSATGVIGSGTRSNYGLRTQPASTGANTAGTQNMYGVYSAPSSTLAAGSTENVYGGYFGGTATLTSGTINRYGLYVANATMNTTGTSTQYGLYVESLTGADTNYAGIFAGGNVGIGDTTPDGLLDLDSSATATNVFGITNTGVFTGTGTSSVAQITANSATTGDLLTISGTALTTGSAIVLTGPSGGTAGVTDAALKITSDVGAIGNNTGLVRFDATFDQSDVSGLAVNQYLTTTNSPSTNANTAYGIRNVVSDTTTLANSIYGTRTEITSTGAAAKNLWSYYGSITSSSTTADTLSGVEVDPSASGAIASGNRIVRGFYTIPESTGANTGGTTDVYGVASTARATGAPASGTATQNVYGYWTNASITGPTTGSNTTDNLYGYYATLTGTHAADVGTINTYGLYVANGTSNTSGTSTKYGIYVESLTGADTNYALVTAGAQSVGINDTTPDALFDIDSATTTTTTFGITHTGIQTSGDMISITSNSTTTGDVMQINATGLESGRALVIAGSTTTGVTSALVNITGDAGGGGAALVSITPDLNPASGSSSGLSLVSTNATTITAQSYSLYNSYALSGNAAKDAVGIYNTLSSSSTTADTLTGLWSTTAVSGIITTGTRNTYGLYSAPSVGAESTGGTTNTYGVYSQVTTDVGAGGTVNGYGLYVANGVFDTDGTSTQYGLYVESPTGADTNYAAIFAGGNVGIGDTTPLALLTVGSGDLFQVNSNGSITQAQAAVSGGQVAVSLTPGAHTAVTAEVSDLAMLAHTNTITGGYTTQRFNRFMIPTISAATALTVTNAATLYVEGQPAVAGAGPAAITNPYALWVDAGIVRTDDDIVITNGAATPLDIHRLDSTAGGATVFNEQGADIDFRIESVGNANMFVLDAGTNTMAIGGAVGNAQVLITGTTPVTGTGVTGRSALRISSTLSPDATADVYGIDLNPTFNEPGSGNQANIASLGINATITAGVGTVDNVSGIRVAQIAAASGTTTGASVWIVGPTTGATTNYSLLVNSGTVSLGTGNVGIGDTTPLALLTVGSGDLFQVNSNGSITQAQSAVSGGQVAVSVTPGAHTAVTAEVSDLAMLAHTNTITGGYTSQRFNRFMIPTISAATALTVTNAATLYVEGQPAVAGAGPAAITNPYALWVDAGIVRTDDDIVITNGAATPLDIIRLDSTAGGATVFNEQGSDIDFRIESVGNANMFNIDAGTNVVGIGVGANSSVGLYASPTLTAAASTVGRAALLDGTITGSVGIDIHKVEIGNTGLVEAASGTHPLLAQLFIYASTATAGNATVTDTATVYIENALSATVTGANYSLFVDAGISRMDGLVQTGLGGTASTTAVCSSLAGATAPTAGTAYELRDCSGTPAADYMEVYAVEPGLEPGDVVGVGTQSVFTTDGEKLAQLTKSSSSYQPNLIGIVSDPKKAGDFNSIGYNIKAEDNPMPVALNGRVPVKVSTENGPIEKGDFLTSSSFPGVAMKATKVGPVVGKALEAFACSTSQVPGLTSEVTGTTSSGVGSDSPEVECQGKILAFVNISWADPNNFLANLSLDQEGNLIVPKIKTDRLLIGQIGQISLISQGTTVVSADPATSPSTSSEQTPNLYFDLSGKIASLEERIKQLEAQNTTQQATSSLNLTPPDILLATGSASLTTGSSEATFSAHLLAYDLSVSNIFKSLGQTFLGKTIVAGDLTVDGTFSISQNAINVIGLNTSEVKKCDYTSEVGCLGVLYLQNNPLAQFLDIFSGKVTIDKEGKLTAQTIIASEYQGVKDKSVGSGKILANTKSVDISSPLVKTTSRILLTPTIETSLTLSVTSKLEGGKFTVTVSQATPFDLDFDWFIINEQSPTASEGSIRPL